MHQKIFNAIESMIYKGYGKSNTFKNYFEKEKDEIILEYLVKITKFSTSTRSHRILKIIYDMYVRRELIKISDHN